MKKRILVPIALLLAVCLVSGIFIASRIVDRHSVENTVREKYGISESFDLEYIGLVGNGNRVLLWYTAENGGEKIHYPISLYALGPKRNLYIFDEVFAPIITDGVAYLKWQEGVAYAVTDPQSGEVCSSVFNRKDVPFIEYRAGDLPPEALNITNLTR